MHAQYPYPYYLPPYLYGLPPPMPTGSGEFPVYANAQPYIHPYPYPYPPPYAMPHSQYPYSSRYYPPYGGGHYPSYSRSVAGSSSVSAPVLPGPFIPTPAQTIQQSSSQRQSSARTSNVKQSSPRTKSAASSNPPASFSSTQPTPSAAQLGNSVTVAMAPPPSHPHHNVFRPSPYTSMSTEPPVIIDPAVQTSTSQNMSFNYYNPDVSFLVPLVICEIIIFIKIRPKFGNERLWMASYIYLSRFLGVPQPHHLRHSLTGS
ncbi:uncharacterized protein BT62DRAFT_82903 [Guyanagaster necrorhizus]|uniref:Uncharacterized protein n=1 Tax=Guyanagaster necrorhizus TaxID=856835 RepID=A0A9P7VSM7_9AGAR|nr:uncharacterized protein BT62DRAFT_82903 [Guyanagaster necrorhizus MCA 3950]KAG7446716.1 hypothetical protein BT62DRAFT_82903 [Guyanagaster necrorhizus MCA 3950]